MPRSILLGRPWPKEGEPLFTQEDTDYVIALAEEEQDTCPSCGLLKIICRAPENQFGTFVVHEEQCHASRVLADHQEATKERPAASHRATQASVRFAEGKVPPLDAGLDLRFLESDSGEPSDER